MPDAVRDGTLHEDLIALLVSRLRVRSYLELGIAQQETLAKVWRACTQKIRVDAVDVKLPPQERRCEYINYHEMTTQEFLRGVPTFAQWQVVFIDADHSEAAVREDLTAVWPHVEEQGLVLLHDTYPASEADTAPGLCGEAWLAAQGLPYSLPTDRAEIVTLPFHPGLTVIRKRQRHLPWL